MRGAVSREEDLAFGSADRLAEYTANEQGNLPPALLDDLQTAVAYARQVDLDIVRAGDLLEQTQDRSLTDTELRELSSLIGASKHNLAALQTWLGDQEAQLRESDGLSEATGRLMDALRMRFGDRHMDLAEVLSLYELDEILSDPVSRADRAGAHLLDAEAALRVANELSVPGLDPSARQQLVDDLREHRDLLAQIKAVSTGQAEAPSDALRLASKQLWDTPLPSVKPSKGKSGQVSKLKAHWDRRAQGRSNEPWLPVAHPHVGQARMLREFMQHRLALAGVPKNRMPNLEFALDRAHTTVVNGQQWETISKQVHTTLRAGTPENVTVESRIMPGKALAAHFSEDYESNGIHCADRTQYKHVPNLALTTLTNEKGRALFSGLRHGVLDAYGIDGKLLANLPDDELRKMVGDLLVREGAEDRDRAIDELVTRIRSDRASAAQSAEAMRVQASRDMAGEMAVAALVADPEKFDRALDGETVTIDLSSISLLTPDWGRHLTGRTHSDEMRMLKHQNAAFARLGQAGTVELPVRDDNGNPRTVRANINVRQFNFGVNKGAVSLNWVPFAGRVAGWGFAMADNDPQLVRLLGPRGSGEPTGDAQAKVESLLDEADELRDHRLPALNDHLARAEPGSATEAGLRGEIAAASERMQTLQGNARTLTQAASHIKEIWESRDYRSDGGDPYKMVSRLALVSHLMGETPLFNCKSGKDRTGQLDAEVKFLATVADNREGRIPLPNQAMRGWRSARSDFTLNTGNLEMQRLNTGLPGYKLKGVEGLKSMFADGMEPVYRGGSDYVDA